MTALEIVKNKGYNPFKTKLVRSNNVYKVYDKVKNEVIVTFTYTPEGNQKVLAKQARIFLCKLLQYFNAVKCGRPVPLHFSLLKR